MAFFEKIVGFIVIPLFMTQLLLLALGFSRKRMHNFIHTISNTSFLFNKRRVYFFPLVASINLITILLYYWDLEKMVEPTDPSARSRYLESLYRHYRNMMLNITCVVLIAELFLNSYMYRKY